MRTLYFDCNMGAAGDMFMAALLDLLPNPARFVRLMNRLEIGGIAVSAAKTVKSGVRGSHVRVVWNGMEEKCRDYTPGDPVQMIRVHGHRNSRGSRTLEDAHHLIDSLSVSRWVKDSAKAVYRLIAEAESHVHGVPVGDIHFHQLGAMDAVADIVGSCMLVEELAPERIMASPIHVGSGQVACAHGVLPVPAPATAHILRGVPVYGGAIQGELCTPTGAALLRHFADEFGGMPTMRVSAIGYGMGSKEFEVLSCLRAFIGICADSEQAGLHTQAI